MTRALTVTPAGYRDVVVTGTQGYLDAVMRRHASTGELVAAGMPRQVSAYDPRMRTVVRLRLVAVRPPAQAPRPRLRLSPRAGWVLAGLATAAGAVTAIAYLIGALVEFAAAHWPAIVGGLVVVALVLIGLSRLTGGSCPGLHCPGPH